MKPRLVGTFFSLGLAIMDLPDMDAALEWANKLPTHGYVEVRELLQF